MTSQLKTRLGLNRSPSYWKVLVAVCAGIVAVGGALSYALPYLNAPGRINETSAALTSIQHSMTEWQIRRAERDAGQDVFQGQVLNRLDRIEGRISQMRLVGEKPLAPLVAVTAPVDVP